MPLRLRGLLHSRWLRIVAVVVAFTVPALTLPSLPRVTIWPMLLGLLPWVVGKYVLCPLRWHALSESGQGRWWHLRAPSTQAEFDNSVETLPLPNPPP